MPLNPNGYIFRPSQSVAEMYAKRAKKRKTPPGYGNGPGTNVKQRPKWSAGDRYTTTSYRRAIIRGVERACHWARGGRIVENDARLVPDWHPHPLRHAQGTAVRHQFGLEYAQAVLGHANAAVTEIYAERNHAAARQVAAAVG